MGLRHHVRAGVEVVHLLVVVPQRGQGFPDHLGQARIRVRAGPGFSENHVWVDREPPRPRGDVAAHGHDDHVDEGRYPVAQEGPPGLRTRTGEPACRPVPDDRDDAHRRQHEHGIPFRGAGQTEHDSSHQTPRTPPLGWTEDPVEMGFADGSQMISQMMTEPVSVSRHRRHTCHQEEGLEDVEQSDPAHDECQAVEGEQDASNGAHHRGPGETSSQPDRHEDEQGPEYHGGESPTKGIETEQLLPDRDEPLSHRGMDDELGVGSPGVRDPVDDAGIGLRSVRPGAFVPLLEHRPGVLGVVGLVEDEVSREADIPHPQQESHCGDEGRDDPARVLIGHSAVVETLDGRQGSSRCCHIAMVEGW